MVELSCETDIVARSDDFRALVRDIAMQVAATDPRYLRAEDVPLDATEEKTESCLLLQPFIKNPHQSVQDLPSALSAKTGEAVRVRRFARFGVDDDRSESLPHRHASG